MRIKDVNLGDEITLQKIYNTKKKLNWNNTGNKKFIKPNKTTAEIFIKIMNLIEDRIAALTDKL